MWEASDWIALAGVGAGVVIGLGSLLVSFFALRHARPESYRAAVYTAQIDGAVRLMEASFRLTEVAHFVALTDGGAGKRRLMQKLRLGLAEVETIRHAHSAVLPLKIHAAGLTHLQAVMKLFFEPEEEERSKAKLGAALDDSWFELVRAVRAELGIAALTDQIRVVTGAALLERRETDRQRRLDFLQVQLEVMQRRGDPDLEREEPRAADT